MRTILALMGIIIGVSAVIIMVAIGNGAKHEVISKIEAMGTNLIVVNAGQVATMVGRRELRGNVTTLTVKDAETIAERIDRVVYAAPVQGKKMLVKYGDAATNTTITGTTTEYIRIRNFNPERGRFFDEMEDRAFRRVAVLGSDAAKNLFALEHPVGKIIRIGRAPFEVIGVLESKGVDLNNFNQDDQIFIPVRTALRRVFNNTYVNSIYIQVDAREAIEETSVRVRGLLRELHRLDRMQKPDDFTIQNQTELVQTREETADAFTTLVGGIAAISLFIGGVGILSIMLLSVRERINEIGLRRAIGASRHDILYQFIFESSVLGIGGGSIGIALGIIGTVFLRHAMSWQIIISPLSILLSFGFSFMVGLTFGIYPARKASLLDPIAALRNE